MKTNPNEKVFCIFYIDNKRWPTIKEDIEKAGYKNLRVYIPLIKIQKRSRSMKDYLEPVPMLFSYGFMRMSIKRAFDKQFLNKLKREIPGIMGWVKAPSYLHRKRKMCRIDNKEDFDDFTMVAMATREEVKSLMKTAKRNRVFSKDDIANIKVGDTVVLHSFPFDGVMAEVLEVNLSSKKVVVMLYPESNYSIKTTVSMESIIYSVYSDYNDNIDEEGGTPDFVMDNLVADETDFDILIDGEE